jgi:hypothetical protein
MVGDLAQRNDEPLRAVTGKRHVRNGRRAVITSPGGLLPPFGEQVGGPFDAVPQRVEDPGGGTEPELLFEVAAGVVVGAAGVPDGERLEGLQGVQRGGEVGDAVGARVGGHGVPQG